MKSIGVTDQTELNPPMTQILKTHYYWENEQNPEPAYTSRKS